MIVNATRKANKGEWAEIYVFLKLIAERVLFSADINYEPLSDKFFNVQKIVREEGSKKSRMKTIYDLSKGDETLVQNGIEDRVVKLGDLKSGVERVFSEILAGKGTFAIPDAEIYMNEYGCSSLKAKSADKSDIFLVIQDSFSRTELSTGFSIKSAFKNAKATLLNTSKRNTNFIYEVVPASSGDSVPGDRVRDVIKEVYQADKKLKFVTMEGEIFRKNLRKVDGSLPEILAVMLKKYYLNEAVDLAELVQLLPADPDLKHLDFSLADYEYKIKQLLEAIALGMVPKKEWSGNSSANGGYIVVKRSGELVCFHRYYRDEFLDYLLKKTYFDTPSKSRHEYGDIYEENGKQMLKLNIQIRFR